MKIHHDRVHQAAPLPFAPHGPCLKLDPCTQHNGGKAEPATPNGELLRRWQEAHVAELLKPSMPRSRAWLTAPRLRADRHPMQVSISHEPFITRPGILLVHPASILCAEPSFRHFLVTRAGMRLRMLDLTCLRSLVDLEDANIVHALDLRAAYAREVVLERERIEKKSRTSAAVRVNLRIVLRNMKRSWNAQNARALAHSTSGQNV